MAVIAYVSNHSISDTFDLTVTVLFFDDNNPANVGVDADNPPSKTLLPPYSWTYPPTLSAGAIQAALAADIRARGAMFLRARTASADAKTMVPVGSLLNLEA